MSAHEALSVVAAGGSIAVIRRALAQAFRAAGLATPDLDARLIVGHALELDHTGLTRAAGQAVAPREVGAIMALAARRLQGEPIARLVGAKEFWGMPLRLSEATLVPRPETETVVEAALAAIGPRSGALRFADLGTGSGALLLALLREWPHAFGIGTDRSEAALATARANARHHGLAARAGFVACDFAAALAGPLDCIVSNPPYISSKAISELPRDVRDYDPPLALDGGPDGLDCYRMIAMQAPRILTPGGFLFVEIGFGQAAAVTDIMGEQGLIAATAPRCDLAGIARALGFRLRP
jgi:release factor glutamine methyltransferase